MRVIGILGVWAWWIEINIGLGQAGLEFPILLDSSVFLSLLAIAHLFIAELSNIIRINVFVVNAIQQQITKLINKDNWGFKTIELKFFMRE